MDLCLCLACVTTRCVSECGRVLCVDKADAVYFGNMLSGALGRGLCVSLKGCAGSGMGRMLSYTSELLSHPEDSCL